MAKKSQKMTSSVSIRCSRVHRFPSPRIVSSGHVLKDVHWETHDGRIRLPVHLTEEHTGEQVHGRADFRSAVKLVHIQSSLASISHSA